MSKVGLAVIGYSRPEYLKQCLESLDKHNWGGADCKIVCLDFKNEELDNENIDVADQSQAQQILSFGKNVGVGANKNRAIGKLLEEGCDHIFLMEDDILMKRADTCAHYIEAARMSGVHHLNFALHGPMNKGHGKVEIWNGMPIVVYPHCVGAFSYYTKYCLDKVGLMDEKFINSMEHVDHTYRIIQAGMHPSFWYFADAPCSEKFLEEIEGSIDNSSIRVQADWQEKVKASKNYWIQKYGAWLPEKKVLQ
jgi:GT2 family glycosyltransferase